MIVGVGIFVFFKNIQPNQDPQELSMATAITHGHGLAVDVADPNKLYIATHHGLLVLINEKDLYRIGTSHDDYMGFSTHPTVPKLFFSSGHPAQGGNIGVQKSEDGGITWEKISQGLGGPVDFHAMAISPVNPEIIYGWYKGAIQRSDDGGKSWNIVNDNLLTVYLTADTQDENIVYAASPDGKGILISKNKGIDWQSLSKELEGGAIATIAIDSKDSKHILTFSEKLGGLVGSIDGGLTWNKINENFNGQTILHMAVDRINPMVVYALTHENAIYKSVDGGEKWLKIY